MRMRAKRSRAFAAASTESAAGYPKTPAARRALIDFLQIIPLRVHKSGSARVESALAAPAADQDFAFLAGFLTAFFSVVFFSTAFLAACSAAAFRMARA
jgi:hypothetical protein